MEIEQILCCIGAAAVFFIMYLRFMKNRDMEDEDVESFNDAEEHRQKCDRKATVTEHVAKDVNVVASEHVAEDAKNIESNQEDDAKTAIQWHTKDFVLEMLLSVGCEPEEDENGDIGFEYQGAYFKIRPADNSPFAMVMLLFWYDFPSYDIEQFSVMQKAVNEANIRFNTTAFYVIDKDAETVYLHAKKQMVFARQLPRFNEYMRSVLRELFLARNFVWVEIQRACPEEASE